MRTRNYNGATLIDCSVRSTTEDSLFLMMSRLSAEELEERIGNIKDPTTRKLAQAHADALTEDWDGPIRM